MVLEDDCVISSDYISNISDFFNNLNVDKFDILFTGFSDNDDKEPLKLIDTREKHKILISKASYVINPSTAKKLLDYLKDYKYNFKHSLSRFLWENKDIRSFMTNKHMFLETSKIGIHPTSINYSNTLIFNPDYIKLIKIVNNDVITNELHQLALETFKRLKNIESSDVHHLISIIYHKQKLYDEAKEHLLTAINIIQKKMDYYVNILKF